MTETTNRPTLGRRLNVADLVVLVLAAAVGLVLVRHDLSALFTQPLDLVNGQWVERWSLPVALSKAVTVEVWLMAWATGWLVLQLRQPRAPLRRLSRRPGFFACASTALIVCVSGPLTWLIVTSRTSHMSEWLDRMVWAELVASQIGAAVFAGWAVLAAGGRCRLRAGWLEQVGRGIGLVWVAMLPLNLLHFFWHSGWSN